MQRMPEFDVRLSNELIAYRLADYEQNGGKHRRQLDRQCCLGMGYSSGVNSRTDIH